MGRVRRWQRAERHHSRLIAAMILRSDTASSMVAGCATSPCAIISGSDHRCLGARESGTKRRAADQALRHRPKELLGVVNLKESACRYRVSEPARASDRCRENRCDRANEPGIVGRVGARSAQRIADRGRGGWQKLLEIRRLAAKGQVVKVIGERQFWRLVAPAGRSPKTKQKRRG